MTLDNILALINKSENVYVRTIVNRDVDTYFKVSKKEAKMVMGSVFTLREKENVDVFVDVFENSLYIG